jgi:hypothetical protein
MKALTRVSACPQSWRAHRRRWDGGKESRWRGRWTETRGGQRRWHAGGENLIHGRWAKGERITAGRSDFQVTGGENPLTQRCYQSAPSMNLDTGDTNHGGGVTGGGIFLALAIWSTLVTVPWQVPFRWTDRAILGPNFSKVSLVTHSTLCSKVAELQTSYNSTIGIKLSWALDHAQNRAWSWCQSTISLKIQTLTSWQPDFKHDYLQIFLNNYAHTLKQSCSP